MTDSQLHLRRVLLADDHGLFRGGLALMLKMLDEDVQIIEANSLEQAMECLASEPDLDLLLLDIMMPGMNSAGNIQQIADRWPDIPIIVISVRDDIPAIRQALSLGAMGYIPKSSSPQVMMGAIRLVLSGGIYVPPDVLRQTSAAAAPAEPAGAPSDPAAAKAGAEALDLTRRQLGVLALMAQGKSNKAIASELGLMPGTVKMHTSRIFRALKVENRTEAVARYLQLKDQDSG